VNTPGTHTFSLGPSIDSSHLDVSAIATARERQPALENSPASRKLRQAAVEFESQLLSSLWKSMKSSFDPEDDSSDPASQSFQDFGVESMCAAVAKAGGLGISKLIVHSLESQIKESPMNATLFQSGKVAQ
jgi:Rod binding domain-containing protein